MAELVYAFDLKSNGETRTGSSPVPATKIIERKKMGRSIEFSRHKDLDMVDAEHLSHEKREASWDDLKNVPFAGNNSLGFEDYTERAQRLFKQMDEVGSFGRGARNRIKKEEEKVDEPPKHGSMDINEISETF